MHRAGLHLALRTMGALVALYIARQSAALPLSTLHCHHAIEKNVIARHIAIISGIAAKHDISGIVANHHQRHCR